MLKDRLAVLSQSLSSDVREASRIAQSLGYAGLQMAVRTQELDLAAFSRSAQRDLLRTLSVVNVRLLATVTSAGRAGFGLGADTDRILDHLEGALRVTADLRLLGEARADIPLCVDLGPLPPPPAEPVKSTDPIDPLLLGPLILPERPARTLPPPTPRTAEDDAFALHVSSALTELARRADRYGVPMALRSDLAPLASIREMVRSVRSPLMGLDLDPAAIANDIWSADEVLNSFAGQVWHVRLRDVRRGSGGRTQATALGEGDGQVAELLRALDQARFAGPLSVDPMAMQDRLGEAKRAAEFVKQLGSV